MGNRSKDATLFALQFRESKGRPWHTIEVRQKKELLVAEQSEMEATRRITPSLRGAALRIKCIRRRDGKWRG